MFLLSLPLHWEHTKLHEQLSANNGTYLIILDEIEGLFESLENKGMPDSLKDEFG